MVVKVEELKVRKKSMEQRWWTHGAHIDKLMGILKEIKLQEQQQGQGLAVGGPEGPHALHGEVIH